MLVGAPFWWIAGRTFRRDRLSTTWPKTLGRVTASHLESWTQTSRDKNGFNVTHTVYSPVVRYTYVADGETREGSRVAQAVDGVAMGQAAAQRVVDAYPVGKSVMVLVDPADPAKTWLEVRRSIGAMILLGFGGLWIGIGVLLVGLSFL